MSSIDDFKGKLSTNYERLKNEAKQCSQIGAMALYELGRRLKIIRDRQLYKKYETYTDDQGKKKEKYKTWDSYLQQEFNIVRSSAMNYIDLVQHLPVQTFEQNPDLNPSKLLPYLPILKDSAVPNSDKKKILRKAVEDAKTTSAREMQKRAREYKAQYSQSSPRQSSASTVVTTQSQTTELELTGDVVSYDGTTVFTFSSSISNHLKNEIVKVLNSNHALLEQLQ